MHVLFATDGSESASRAQRLVASIDWPDPTKIEVLHVDQLLTGDLDVPPEAYTELHEKIRAEIRKDLEATKCVLAGPGREIATAMILGRPASVIVDEARMMPVDIVVVGSHGRGALTSALLGSVAEEVVDHAPCPVLVARRDKISRLVLAVDAVKRLAAAGIKASSEVREALPALGIVAAAGDTGADLIVMGTRGQTGLTRLLLGSVARGVLHRARCSVLTMRGRVQS